MPVSQRSIVTFVICLAVCFAPGVVGSLFMPGDWYARSARSSLTPPGWVFPVVWNILYLLMAVALFLVVRARGLGGAPLAVGVFVAQLVLNGVWSWLFFGLHRPGAALADLAVLWVLIVASVVLFWRARPSAGAVLLPYLAWVSFAAYLNYAFWTLNR